MGAFDWLKGGNDRELAATTYAGRESASDEASRLRRAKHKIRVKRDGDKAGMKFGRRSDWT
ncbi:hypothetical protein [Streptomyces griseus]|uniref:hypothetical protein n=1 Tax=Streptomyces griseus TaxID=1911 RepID=UPI000A3A7672|nr:hypothetical protein [Streptomyces fimicarius]